jgi:hypothetical protein
MKLSIETVDVSTRGKRCEATAMAVGLLEKIRHAEEAYMERIPFNLRPGKQYAKADCSVDTLICAIVELLSAYDE